MVPGYLILYADLPAVHSRSGYRDRRLEAWHIIQANAIGLMAAIVILVLYVHAAGEFLQDHDCSFSSCVNVVPGSADAQRDPAVPAQTSARMDYNQKHMLLVGYSRAAEQYIDRIKANPEWGYNIRGILDDHAAERNASTGASR